MKSRIHWAWVILVCSFITVFTNYSIRLGYGILMPEMIISLRITKAQAGAIASSFYLTYTIFSPLVGFLVDRLSARTLITFFSFILAGGTFLMHMPDSLFQAGLFFGIVGMGSSAMWTPVVTVVQRWFGVRRRGMVLGILSMSYTLGYGIMGLALPPLVGRYDWRACWLALSGLAFALVPLNAAFLRSRPQEMDRSPWGDESPVRPRISSGQTQPRVRYGELLQVRNLWLVGISYFFIGFTAYVVNTFIVTYGNMELQFPFAQAAQLASAIAFSGMAGALFIPMLSDFLGRKKCLILINSSMAASILLIIWAGKNWAILLPAVCLFGVFYAAAWPMYAAAAADFFPLGATGSVLGFWTIFYGLGVILSPSLGGYIADLTGTFTWSFLMAALTGAVATFFLSRITEPTFN
jgi:sugar phosphate permease